MKKFELYLGIAMIIAVTALICIYMLVMEYTNERFMFITSFSMIGYIVAYLFIDSYIGRIKIDNYLKGYDDHKASTDNFDKKYAKWYEQYTKWCEENTKNN
jgi:hypothetical protein